MKRTLSLKRESLTELTTGELTSIVGGVLPTLPLGECLSKYVDTMQPTRCVCP